MNVLFVCTGNICRSSMALGLFRHMALDRGVAERFNLRSCGTFASDGNPATPESVQAAMRLGVDISTHRATSCSKELLDWADVIYCMAQHHRDALLLIRPEAASKIHLLRREGDVEDPYGTNLGVYINTSGIISKSVSERLDELCELL